MKHFLKNALLVVFALIIGIVISEFVLAFFFPQKIINVKFMFPFFGKYDPELGWVNKENAQGMYRASPGDPGTSIRINSSGLRGGEISAAGVPGRKRILVLGDSVTFGYGLNEEDTYPVILQEILGSKFEVLNAGVTGYGLDQEYLFLKRAYARFQPDIVIVGFSAGDIYDSTCSMRYGTLKPYFRIEDGSLKLFNTPVPERVPIKELLDRSSSWNFLLQHSNLYRLLYYRFSDPGRILRNISKEEMNIFEGTNVSMEIIREMKRECDLKGCKLIFLVIPQEDWLQAAAASPENSEIFMRGHNAALQVVLQAGVTYLDLWGPFSDNLTDGLFLSGDPVHTNRNGNSLIAAVLQRSGLLK